MLGFFLAAMLGLAPSPSMTVLAQPVTVPESGAAHVRVRIDRAGATPLRLRFTLYVTSVDGSVRLRDGSVAALHGGMLDPFARRAVATTDPSVALPDGLPDPAYVTLTVRAEDLRFATPTLETNWPANPPGIPEAFYLITIGLLTGIALYHLMLFFALRDPEIGLYVAYLAAFVLYEFVASALAWRYLWPWASIPAVAALRVSAALVAVSVLFFARRFMRTAVHAAILDRLFVASVSLTVLATILGLAVASLSAALAITADMTLLLGIVFCSACAVACIRKGERSAVFFMIGFSGLFVGAIAKIVFDDLGMLETSAHYYGIELGVCFDAVVLAFGLAERLRRETAQRERAEALAAEQERLARTDQLTSVANRRMFDERLLAEWSRATRHGTPLALIMLDVDRFKAFNDMRGHLAGDDCLKLVAHACRSTVQRADEIFARYGGEEFAAVLPGATLEHARRTAELMIEKVRELDISHPKGGLLTISVGVAAYSGGQHYDVDVLIADADAALYRAKDLGGDQVAASSDSTAATA